MAKLGGIENNWRRLQRLTNFFHGVFEFSQYLWTFIRFLFFYFPSASPLNVVCWLWLLEMWHPFLRAVRYPWLIIDRCLVWLRIFMKCQKGCCSLSVKFKFSNRIFWGYFSYAFKVTHVKFPQTSMPSISELILVKR